MDAVIEAEIEALVGIEPLREDEYPTYFKVGHDNVTRIVRRDVYNSCLVDEFDVYKGGQLVCTMMTAAVAEVYYKQGEDNNPIG